MTQIELPEELREEPRYRVLGNDYVGINGLPYGPGSIFKTNGWPPKANIEPLNEPARRILAYDRAGRWGLGPETPFDFALGRFYLPDLSDVDRRSNTVRIVADHNVLPGMPTWRSRIDLPLQRYIGDDRNRYGRDVHQGDLIVVIVWPRLIYASEFEPADEAAEQVRAYYDKNREHPKLPISPWDCFARSLFLPDLPEVKRHLRDPMQPYSPTLRPDPLISRSERHGGARRPFAAAR